MSGRVVLVGAGPGDPDLLTVRAVREIARAEVLLYDALLQPEILDLASPDCERIDVGKRGDGTRGVSLDLIADLLVEKAKQGRYVVRLKGGDPFLFGRGGEEVSAVVAAGLPFEVVPGVTSAIAVPAYAGIPITDRRLSSSLAVVTGHRGKNVEDSRTDWEGLARSAETLVILMGTRWLEDIVQRLIAGGRDPGTPGAVISHGTTHRQRTVSAPLRELASRVREAGLEAPTVIVIGEVARLRETMSWFEKRPLFGRRVLVTRAEESSGEISRLLLSRGAEPVVVPLLAFAPPADASPARAALEAVDRYDWLVYTSATAVRFAAPAAPPRGRVACIGLATAAAAKRAGLAVAVTPPERSLPDDLAEAMAACAPLSGTRVLFPCAERARDALRRALERAGATVDRVVAYQTAIPKDAAARLDKAVADGLDAVLLTSPSTVAHLCELLGELRVRQLAGGVALAAIGPTTEAALRERGLEAAVVAERQTGEDLVRALERRFSEVSDAVS